MDTLIKKHDRWWDITPMEIVIVKDGELMDICFRGYLLRRAAGARKFFLPFSCVCRKKAVPLQRENQR